MRKVGVTLSCRVTPTPFIRLRLASASLALLSVIACGDVANDAPPRVRTEDPPPSAAVASSPSAPPRSAESTVSLAPSAGLTAHLASSVVRPPRSAQLPASALAPSPSTPPEIIVPASVVAANARRPFLLLLHGYSGSGAAIAKHVGLAALAEAKGFSYAAPDGSLDRSKRRHWNAGPSCCDFDRLGADHVSALRAVLDAARASPVVDPARVYVAGFSNGAFMAERLACDVPGIAGVLDVAGSAPTDVAGCRAPPLATLIHVHGELDPTVRIEGGRVLGRTDVAAHPSAADAVAAWAKRAGCGTPAPAGTLDLETSVAGAETARSRHQGCPGRFELLRIADGGHDVASSPAAFATLITILLGEGS